LYFQNCFKLDHLFKAVPSLHQDLDFQRHVVLFFLCSVSEGQRWLFVLLILVGLLTITI